MPAENVKDGPEVMDRQTVAILPFKNMSSDPENEYFADGLTEELIIALAAIDRLKVISRTSVMQYKTSSKGVIDIAKELAAGHGNADSVAFNLLVEGQRCDLDPTLQDEIYRIAREALGNAFQHSKAHKIEAEITYGESTFRLRIRDDGSGIDPNVRDLGGRTGHWGLTGMRERAQMLGGELQVWSREGAGTEVDLTIPNSIAYALRSKSRLLRRKRENSGHQA